MSASSDDDALERQRPPAVAVPHDGEYGPGGPGKVHSASPGLALRKMGKGPAFTPIRENSNPNALDSDRSHGSHIGAGFLFLRRIIAKILAFINSIAVQSSLYLAYVIVFQLLTASIRLKEEYHFDKMIADTFLDNHFDAAHNTFQTMRRVSDVYEWGNNVLIPGLFANSGPCATDVGAGGFFESATDRAAPTDFAAALAAKGCNDDAWPDGRGSFHLTDATAWSVAEVAEGFDFFDWSEGIIIKQLRVAPKSAAACYTRLHSGVCLPEIEGAAPSTTSRATSTADRIALSGSGGDGVSMSGSGAATSSVSSHLGYGHNWTHPTAPLAHPFRYFTAQELGGNPVGVMSASVPSFRTFESGGHVAVIIPFLSRTHLPEQRGNASQVIDFRLHTVRRHSHGEASAPASRAPPEHFCVRLSWNGDHIHQLCDPNDPLTNRTTGVVRAAVEEFWNDLKRAHYIDRRTRSVTITLPLRSNFLAVRSRVTLMVEQTATGAVLPSYDIETRVESSAKLEVTRFYVNIALILCFVFIFIECIEVCAEGLVSYFTDPWNMMDWMNFGVFFLTWVTLQRTFALIDAGDACTSALCTNVGYFDDWELMDAMRSAKLYLSMCVCIQLLKMIKFLKQLIPKMALATAVLYKGMMDLIFFGVVFFLTMFAFAMMFYVQLGPNMEGYSDLYSSFFSLARALFGDFDVPDILNNSRGYLNVGFFILYLFVAVFVMLSMFLAILGESQAAVRMDQDEKRRLETAEPEYGVFSYAYDGVARVAHGLRQRLWRPRAQVRSPSSLNAHKNGRVDPGHIEPPPPPAETLTDVYHGGGGGGGFGVHEYPPPPPVQPPLQSARSLSVRTEIRELAAEVTSIAERQKRISSHLKSLDPKQLSLQLGRLAAAIEGLEGAGRGALDRGRRNTTDVSSTARPSIGGQDGRPAAGRHPPTLKGAPPRQMPGPLLGVCLGEAENQPTNPSFSDKRTASGGGAAAQYQSHGEIVPAPGPSPGQVGWAKARSAFNTGRIQQMLRDEGDTPARPRRERAPSVRGEARRDVKRIARAAAEQQHGRRSSHGGEEASFVI